MDFARETPIHISKVQELLGVGRSTVEGWFAKGLEWRKVGGKVFTTREAIERFSVGPAPQPQQRQRRDTSETMEHEAAEQASRLIASFTKKKTRRQ